MHDRNVLCAIPGTDPSIPTVLVSETPGPGRIQVPGNDGAPHVSLDVAFWQPDFPAGTSETAMSGPIFNARAVVPLGWIAHIHLITLMTHDQGDDIGNVSAKLYSGIDSEYNDDSASFETLALVPGAQYKYASAAPLAPPFVIDATAELHVFGMHITTDGLTGTVGVVCRVIGLMYKAPV